MTDLPARYPGQTQLGLVIDLDVCVGCHACATACKEWNTGGHMAPLPDFHPLATAAGGAGSNASIRSGRARAEARAPCPSRNSACLAAKRPWVPVARPAA